MARQNYYWHNFVNKGYRSGKTFEQIAKRFLLEVFYGTRHESEKQEEHYTNLYDALAPNGFVTKAGNYRGVLSDAARTKIKKHWRDPEKRKIQSENLKHNHRIPEVREREAENPR